MKLRTDYQKLEHQRDPSQPLTACQQWKLTDLSYLKTFYKQGHRSARGATSRTSTEHSSDEEADDRGHESSSSSRRETPTKIPVLNLPTPARRPKKRRDDRTDSDKDETSSKLNEIVGVMKDSANHLVARSQTLAHDPREQERVSFFQCHVRIGGNSKSKPSPWHALTPQQTLPKATPRDHGYRRSLLPLHRKLITVNNTQ